MSSVIQLNGTRRTRLGKGGARKARAAGQIPGVVYGHGEEPVAVAVDSREFQTKLRTHQGGNAIVNLKVEGAEYTALVRDAQYDPVSNVVLHLDFQHISLTETIEVDVAVHALGIAAGVKDGGGILEMIVRTVTVRCLPTAIPDFINVDVTALQIGESVHVKDLITEGVEVLSEPETTLITIVPPTVEEVAPVEGVLAPGTPEPEVVGAKGKKDEAGAVADKKDDKKDKDKK
jgi:large subunit ribosomal protein L25